MRRLLPLAAALLLPPHTVPAFPGQDPAPSKPPVGASVEKEREQLANYRWRMKTEMRVDDELRQMRLEDCNLTPDGDIAKRMVRYERKPYPTPYPYGDPRNRLDPLPGELEEDKLFDAAQRVMQLYLKLSRRALDAWASRATLLPPAPDKPGLIRLQGRGLGRPQDEAVLYLEEGTRRPTEIEVKTTVDPTITDIAFIRATFDTLPAARPGLEPLVVPKKIFLNMNRGKHRVSLEMETSEYRTWP